MDAAPEPPLSLTQAQNPANHLWRTVGRNKRSALRHSRDKSERRLDNDTGERV
jgi:hypothetical protein